MNWETCESKFIFIKKVIPEFYPILVVVLLLYYREPAYLKGFLSSLDLVDKILHRSDYPQRFYYHLEQFRQLHIQYLEQKMNNLH